MSRRRNHGSSRGRSSRRSRAAPDDLGSGSHVPPGSWDDSAPTWNAPSSSTVPADVDGGNSWGSDVNWGSDVHWGNYNSDEEGWPNAAEITSSNWGSWNDWNDWDRGGMRVRFYSCTSLIASMTGQLHPPHVETGSRQREMESMRRYFDRLSVESSAITASESAVQRQRRLSREAAMAHSPEPGRRGAIVFRWVDHNGFRVRSRCNRQTATTIWEMYAGENMRRYDSIHNEWDVCTEFFPEDNFDLFDSTTLAAFERIEPTQSVSPVLPPYPPLSPRPPPHELAVDRSADYVFGSFVDTLYYRYGFLSSSEDITTPDPAWEFASVRQYVLDNQSPLLAMDEIQCKSVVAFFYHLASGSGLSALSDLSDSSTNPVSDHAANFPIAPVLLDGERYFLLTNEQSRDRCIAIRDPISVLQIFRQGWHVDPPSLVRRLLCRGVPLNTFLITRPRDEIPPLAELGPPLPLPRVPIQLDWQTIDYGTYEQARNTFLARSYARAALLKGGIVGRLAREYLDIASMTADPSGDVFAYGTSFHSADGRFFWDDIIDGAEMDLICGVYKTPTGQGTQTADLLVAETIDLGGLECRCWILDA